MGGRFRGARLALTLGSPPGGDLFALESSLALHLRSRATPGAKQDDRASTRSSRPPDSPSTPSSMGRSPACKRRHLSRASLAVTPSSAATPSMDESAAAPSSITSSQVPLHAVIYCSWPWMNLMVARPPIHQTGVGGDGPGWPSGAREGRCPRACVRPPLGWR
jgi:hypothetical protein